MDMAYIITEDNFKKVTKNIIKQALSEHKKKLTFYITIDLKTFRIVRDTSLQALTHLIEDTGHDVRYFFEKELSRGIMAEWIRRHKKARKTGGKRETKGARKAERPNRRDNPPYLRLIKTD